jgi:hypothetical protein
MFTRFRLVLPSFGLAIALAFQVSASIAEPAPSDPAAARALFDQGRAMLDAGDWAGACRKFDESLVLSSNVSTLIKVARCRAHEGKLATAAEQYERARALNQQKSDQPSERRAELDATIETEVNDLTPRIPRLRVLVVDAPAGLTVRYNGVPLAPARLGETLQVDPGTYQISAEAPGFVAETKSVTIGERTAPNQVIEVSFRLTPAPPAPSATPVPPVVPVPAASLPALTGAPANSEPSERPRGGSTRQAGYVVGGVGVAALAAAGVLGILTLKRVDDGDDYCKFPGEACNARGMELRDQARHLQTSAFVVAGLGAAALATGIVLVVTAKGQPPSAALVLSPNSVAGRVQW